MTTYVGKLYPSRTAFAIPVQNKGVDEYVCNRLVNFLKQSGTQRFVYMSGQDGALRTFTEGAISQPGINEELVRAVPEVSPVGESHANGKAEKAARKWKTSSVS